MGTTEEELRDNLHYQSLKERDEIKYEQKFQKDLSKFLTKEGSTVEYGAINKFYISNSGTYPMPYDSTGLKVDLTKLPKFDITGIHPKDDKSYSITLSNTSQRSLIRLSSSIKSINFNNLVNQYLSDGVTANPFYGKLSGYQSKPIIEVINNNPQTKLNFTNFNTINEYTNDFYSFKIGRAHV